VLLLRCLLQPLLLLLAVGLAAQGCLGLPAAASQPAVCLHLRLLLLQQHLLMLLIQLRPCHDHLQLDLPGALQQVMLHALGPQALLKEQQWALPLVQPLVQRVAQQ
jgi:hypothetical protein